MPASSGYGNVQFALNGCTDLGPPWGSTPAPAAQAPTPTPIPASTPAPTVTTQKGVSSAAPNKQPASSAPAPINVLESTNDGAVQASATAADLTPNQTPSVQVLKTSTTKPVAKWPYATPYFCSAYVEGTGNLGGLRSVRVRGLPSSVFAFGA